MTSINITVLMGIFSNDTSTRGFIGFENADSVQTVLESSHEINNNICYTYTRARTVSGDFKQGGKGGVSITNHERIFPQITNHVCILCNFTNYVFSYVMTENDSRKLLDLRCIFSDFSW